MNSEHLLDLLTQVNDEYIKEAVPQRKADRKRFFLKGAAAAGIILVFAAGLLVNRYFTQSPGGIPYETGSGASTTPANPGASGEFAFGAKIVVNELNGISTADIDAQCTFYDDVSEEQWTAVLDEFREFTGISYESFASSLETMCEITGFSSMSARNFANNTPDAQYSLHDYIFNCRTANEGSITIAVCPFEAPLRDCILESDNPKQSEINGIPLVIYGFDHSFMVRFFDQKLYYDIETTDLTLEELQQLLSLLISVSNS